MRSVRKWGKKIKSKVSKSEENNEPAHDDFTDSDSGGDPLSFLHMGREPLNVDKESGAMIMESTFGYPYPAEIEQARQQAETGRPITWAEVQAREDRWELEKRNLEISQGLVPRRGLCRICRAIKLLVGDKFTTNSKIQFVPFGTSTQIVCRSRYCAICSLVMEIITCNSDAVHPALTAVHSDVQGTQLHPEVLPSGEVVLGVEHALRRIGAIRILVVENAMDVMRQAYEHHTAKEKAAADNIFLDTDGQKVSRDVIRKWLVDCEGEHGSVCNRSVVEPTKEEVMEIMLIDTVEQRLIRSTTAVKFFALSYVWGKVSIPLTLLSNVETRRMENGLSEHAIEFPQVIKDAISLVKEVGERYLWVDALCIVQDDSTAKHQQIQRMDRIYSEAFATIVALAGEDANASLPGVRGGTRKPQEMHHVEGLSMVATPPPLKYILDISKWDTRAWTTQERMLSRRCIFFSKNHMYFQCGEKVLCEIGGNTSSGGEKSTLHINPLLPYLCRENLDDREEEAENAKAEEGGEEDGEEDWETASSASSESAGMRQARLRARPRQTKSRDTHLRHPPWRFNFELYEHLVGMYTKRELSYIADIENAFSGLSAVLANVFSTKLFYGLPAEALDLALLWTPVSTVHRRTRLPENGAPTEYDFPSWSWMGWVGAVNYLIAKEKEDDYAIPEVATFYISHHGTPHLVQKRTWTKTESYVPSQIQQFLPAWVKRPDSPPRVPDSVPRPLPVLRPEIDAVDFLQFWAQVVPASRFALRDAPIIYLSSASHSLAQGRQGVRRLMNRKNQHCGMLFTTPETDVLNADGVDRDFVLLSRYKDGEEQRMELDTTAGGVSIWDHRAFGRAMVGGSLMNVLLVEKCGDGGVSRRVSVAQIHGKAWEEGEPDMRLVAMV